MKREFNTSEWFIWEQNASPMLLIMTLEPSFPYLRKYLGSCFFNSLIIFEPDEKGNYQGKWLFRHEEARVLGQKMVDMLMCTPYRNTFDKQIELAKKNLIRKAQEIEFSAEIEKVDVQTLVNIFEDLYKVYCEYYKYAWFTESLQWQSTHILDKYLKENFKENESEVLKALLTTEYQSFGIDILEDLKSIKEGHLEEISSGNHSKELLAKCEEHSNKYYWKNNNYFSTKYITLGDVLKELEELGEIKIESGYDLLKQKAEIYSDLPAYYKGIVDLCNMAGIMGDTRKATIMTANSAFDKLLKAMAEKSDVSLEEIKMLIPQELKYFIESPEEYKERFELRKERFMVAQSDFPLEDDLIEIPSNDEELESWTVSPMNEPFIVEGKEVENVISELDVRLNLLKHSVGERETLKGVATFYNKEQPTISGVVRVIKDPKIEKLEEGEILVAPSTTPDYLDAMNKCKTIITDWGGQTSHAAIVSREMRKPCIIGTNFASRILKNGDEIKIDFEKGTIEIVEK
ncbi:MAG: PEP-utilizing enzyme [Oscillospiraceae bacterium]|nr:PEP-utilizing enzyme [Oscillospiraceae bacterium]